jgi:hypothetical protein
MGAGKYDVGCICQAKDGYDMQMGGGEGTRGGHCFFSLICRRGFRSDYCEQSRRIRSSVCVCVLLKRSGSACRAGT